ncbi:MAG: cupin domain-containing protein [Burkholderiaceae bacterium]
MSEQAKLKPLIVTPDAGRLYPMGPMSAVFKADLDETNSTLSVSEWWLEPDTEGPPIHQHSEAHLFYVLDGTLAVYVEGKDWFLAEKGSYIYIPGNTDHGFENRSGEKTGFMSINTPGGFERTLPHIVDYFQDNPLGSAKG